MFCIECGQQIPEDSKFCASCGATVTEAAADVFCIQCGQEIPSDSDFCTSCGAKVETEVQEETPVPEPVPEPQLVEEPVVVAQPAAAPAPKEGSRNLVMVLIITTVVLLAAVVGLVIYMVVGRGDSGYDDAGNQQAYQDTQIPAGVYMPADEYHVQRVRNGHLPNHPDVAIGFALERFLVEIEWIHSYVPQENLNRVFVHGYMPRDINDPDGEQVMGQFVFQFAADGSFVPIRFVWGGNFEDVRVMYDVLDHIMELSR